MRIWGKIIGGFFGYLLAGYFGMLLGIFIGHLFDQGLNLHWQNWSQASNNTEAQQAFFNTTFQVMGHIAKADGRVSEAEIHTARSVMSRMGLNEDQRQKAINLFEQGKRPDFNLEAALSHLVSACHHNKVLLRLFVELQTQTALADGHPSQAKQRILQTIYRYLGFQPFNFAFFEDLFSGYQGQGQQQYRNYTRPSSQTSLADAYKILEISETVSNAEVKKAYRKLMNQHHPDKLIAKGLPEGMVKLATEKTQKIQAAYEKICAARGM